MPLKKVSLLPNYFYNLWTLKTVLLGMEWSWQDENFIIPRDGSDARIFYILNAMNAVRRVEQDFSARSTTSLQEGLSRGEG